MKQIIFLPFSFFFISILSLACLHGQGTKTVLAVAPAFQSPPISKLIGASPRLIAETDLHVPVHRIPKHLYKQYMIRVKQTDTRQLTQLISAQNYTLYSTKSADHEGYDYYLPVSFDAKAHGEVFMSQLPKALAQKAMLLKLDPNKQKCHCFGKF